MGVTAVRRARPLRVAHLIESDGPGGAERIVADLARTLQADGIENVAILPAGGEGWLARQLEGSGVAVEHVDLSGPVSTTCARTMTDTFRRHRIDIAHSHEFTMAVYGGWASWRTGIPHVITMHGSRYYAGRWRRRLALRAAIRRRTRLVAVSRQLASSLCRDGIARPGTVDMIVNGVRHVAAPPRSDVRRDLSLADSDRLVVAVGNLYPVKGHSVLIDALRLLAERHPTLHVAIAGRGDLASALTAQASAYGLAQRVHLLGLRSDVAAVLAASDLFTLPSLSEGLSLALLEAMFAGRPIVASDVGESAAVLDAGRAGVVVPPGDAVALANAIDHLLRDPDAARSLGARARARAIAEYDIEHMVRRYRSLYDSLL